MPSQNNEKWPKRAASPATTSSKRTRIIIKSSNENTCQKNTSAGIIKMTKPHNLPLVPLSLNESPTSTTQSTIQSQRFVNLPTRRHAGQSPRFINSPTRPSLKRKKPDNHSAHKWANRSETTTPKKRRRSRHIIIDSSDEESELGEKSHENAKTARHSKPRASTTSRRVFIDSSDEAPEQEANLGLHQNPKPSIPLNNGGATSLCNIVKDLASFPTGEVAYGAELADLPLPDIEVLNIGVLQYPYVESQLDEVKELAKQLRDNRSGINWEKIKRTPMWYVFNFTKPELTRQNPYR